MFCALFRFLIKASLGGMHFNGCYLYSGLGGFIPRTHRNHYASPSGTNGAMRVLLLQVTQREYGSPSSASPLVLLVTLR